MTTDQIRAFRQAYLDTLPPDDPARGEPIPADAFGDSPELADELLALVLAGTKTATCSSVWEWEAEGEAPPIVGVQNHFPRRRRRPALRRRNDRSAGAAHA